MTEKESLAFWGDLVKPIATMLDALAIQGQLPMIHVLRAVIQKAEESAECKAHVLNERAECEKVCRDLAKNQGGSRRTILELAAKNIRARKDHDCAPKKTPSGL
jgi:hypothetical protein